MKGRFSLLLAAATAIASSGGAMAQMSYDPVGQKAKERSPVYIGIGLTSANSKLPQGTIDAFGNANLAALGGAYYITNIDQRTNGAKVFIGYRFTKYLSVEAGGIHFGEPGVGYQFYASGGAGGLGEGKIDYAMGAVFVDAVGTWYLTEKFALLGRVGVARGQTRVDFNGLPLVFIAGNNDRTERNTRIKYGLGLQYDLTESVMLRAEWERYTLPDPLSDDKVKVDSFSGSLMYQF